MPETAANSSKRAKSAAKPKAAAKAGKPRNTSTYDPIIARAICEQLSEGIPLRQICRENDGFPAWRTVYDWMAKDPQLATAIAYARDVGYDSIAEHCMEIADTPLMMTKVTESTDPKTGLVTRVITRSDDVNARRLQVETRLKLLAKFNPKKYGDRMAVEGVEGGAAIKTEDTNADRFLEIIRNMEMTKRAG